MRWLTTIALATFLVSCKSPTESPAPTENRYYVDNISYTIDTVYFANKAVHATGVIKNIGTSPISPVFYVSGEFFKRNTFVTSLGETRFAVTRACVVNDTIHWQLTQPIAGDSLDYLFPALAKMSVYYVE